VQRSGAIYPSGVVGHFRGGGAGGGGTAGSAEVGVSAREVVTDLSAHAGVDVVLVEVDGLDEVDAVGLVVDGGLAADGAADVGVLVLLADLAVGVGDDVLRIGVHPEEVGDLGEDAGLLPAFADGALGGGLADVLGAAGQGPLASVATALSRMAPVSSTTSRLLAGMRVLALGALGHGCPGRRSTVAL